MATISQTTDEREFRIASFLGLNENPDGDTKLKMGESSQCENWCVTRDRNLRRRNGSKSVATLGGSVAGMWCGFIDGKEEFIAATNGHLYRIWDSDNSQWIDEDLGLISTDNRVSFLAFNKAVYMLNGSEYKVFDGISLKNVQGYRPLVITNRTPAGASSQTLEQVNKLNALRRVWFTSDGSATEYLLPNDTALASVDYVKNLTTGELYANSSYTIDLANFKVTFTTAPTSGTNNVEIGYSVVGDYRKQVLAMTNFELYSGASDQYVFIYGDGSNEAFYSGIDYDGNPRADYFPDLNEIAIGSANTSITSLIRHYSTLIAFKEDSTYAITYGTITVGDETTEAFYSKTINRAIGNIAKGQVHLVLNSPRALFGNDLYEWKNNSYYSSNLTVDERQAKRISDRINYTLSSFDLKNAYCYDDNEHQEYYIVNPSTNEALVHNYVADAWYFYTNFDMQSACVFQGDLYYGTSTGKVRKFSDEWYADDDVAFSSYWESGAMDFGRPFMNKYSSMLWIGIKPDSRGKVLTTVQTDRKASFNEKETTSFLLDFGDIDFSNFSFDVDRSPKIHRHKIKAKKFVYYKLIFKSDDATTSATVTDASIRVRFAGYAK